MLDKIGGFKRLKDISSKFNDELYLVKFEIQL